MSYEDYFYKVKSDVFKTENFKEFCKLHTIFEKFLEYEDGGTWLEKHYDAIKARPDREIYCARTLQMPKALKFSDVFSHAEIRPEKTPNPLGDYFCSTRDKIFKDGWQGEGKNQKFLHLRVVPTAETVKAFENHIGYRIGSFEIIQRGEEFLIIATSSESSIFKSWLAIVYDVDQFIKDNNL